MSPILCPRCQVRVLPSADGVCPGCRTVIAPAKAPSGPPTQECPECHAPLAENAVLCVACGYHLKQEGFLTTAVERPPSPRSSSQPSFRDADLALGPPLAGGGTPFATKASDNPYAAPAILSDYPAVPASGDVFVADLTPQAALRARAIVADAERFYLVLFVSICFCRIAWLVMFPWYGWRLYSWYDLNRTYSELRNPTPRASAHYSLARDFQGAKGRILAGVIVGSIIYALYAFAIVYGVFFGPPPGR